MKEDVLRNLSASITKVLEILLVTIMNINLAGSCVMAQIHKHQQKTSAQDLMSLSSWECPGEDMKTNDHEKLELNPWSYSKQKLAKKLVEVRKTSNLKFKI